MEPIEKAKLLYPIETQFESIIEPGKIEVAEIEPYYYGWGNLAVKEREGVIYYGKTWARIITKPEISYSIYH